jgi:predicted nucleotidyltransferase
MERERLTQRRVARAAARAAAAALRDRYGSEVEIFLFGSAAGRSPFRLDSDVDLAVAGLPRGQYYEAWAVAEAAARSADVARLDLVEMARLDRQRTTLQRDALLRHGSGTGEAGG